MFKLEKGKNKRFKAIFDTEGVEKVVEFGQKEGSTYIDHSDKNKRKNYLKRHSKNPLEEKLFKNKKKYYNTPSILSADILWGKSDNIKTNVKNYVKKYL